VPFALIVGEEKGKKQGSGLNYAAQNSMATAAVASAQPKVEPPTHQIWTEELYWPVHQRMKRYDCGKEKRRSDCVSDFPLA
jgi:hypothetical protein